jgi:hypothetical protein
MRRTRSFNRNLRHPHLRTTSSKTGDVNDDVGCADAPSPSLLSAGTKGWLPLPLDFLPFFFGAICKTTEKGARRQKGATGIASK